MLLLYPLKPGICQCFPTKAYWKYSNVNTSSSSEPLATYPNQHFFLVEGVIFVSRLENQLKPSVSQAWKPQLVSSLRSSLKEPCELLIFSCSDYLAYCTAHSLKQQKNPILKTNVGLFIFKLASHYLTLLVSGALKAIDSLFTWTLELK